MPVHLPPKFTPLSLLQRLALLLLLLLISVYFLSSQVSSQPYNGFDISNASIPANEIFHGGPPRDGIPAIDHPRFINGRDADFLAKDDRVLGIHYNNISKAYPIRILNWHEIVNDQLDTQTVVISYCPLCGSGMIFANQAQQGFGVSGLLYNSDMLLYDRKTESLWSQILGQSISGPLKGQRLQLLASEHTSWQDWLTKHPETLVLSARTGYRRDYNHSPYQGYETSAQLYFPIKQQHPRYHPKEKVIGLEINGQFKAYPFIELDKSRQTLINDQFADQAIIIEFDAANRSAIVKHRSGPLIPSLISYWFAWYAFHPDTLVYTAPKK